MDLLEKSPGVTVEQNTIQLQGRDAVTIYIDDRPTYLSGDALAASSWYSAQFRFREKTYGYHTANGAQSEMNRVGN